MKTITAIIEIQTQSPLHVTAIEAGRYSAATGTVYRYDAPNTISCSLTRTMAVRKSSPTETEEGRPIDFARLPTIPANTLGGKLRTLACELVEESLVLRGLKLTPKTFNTLRKGTATSTLRRNEQTIQMARYGARHPLIGIFGGTSFGIDANLVVNEGWPITEDTLPFLQIAPMSAEPIRDYRLTEVIPIVRRDAIIDLQRPEHLAALIGTDEINAYHDTEVQRTVDKKARKADGEDAGKKESLRHLGSMEAVRAGVSFQLAFTLRARTDEQVGMLLLALRALVDAGQIGGKAARGFGKFAVTASRTQVVEADGSVVEAPLFGSRVEGGGYAWNLSDELASALAAAESWVESVDPRELEMLCSEEAPSKIKALS